MHMKIAVVLLLAVVCAVSAIVCPKGYCETVRCDNAIEREECEQNMNGIFEQKGTFCGCCPACLTKISEGENCRLTRIGGLSVPPKAKCAPGLTCDPITSKCVIAAQN